MKAAGVQRPAPCRRGVPGIHGLLHRTNTWASAARWVAVLAFTTSTAACRRTAGEGEACGWGTSCVDGLACSEATGTCLNLPLGQPPTPSCSDPLVTDACAPYESTTVCPSADLASQTASALGDGCRTTSYRGSPAVCCPGCVRVTFGCGAPASGYACVDPHSPVELTSSMQCVLDFRYSIPAGQSVLCCTSSDACFRTDVESPSSCGDAGTSYACTGSATPEEAGLLCWPAPDAGSSNRYCCDEPLEAGASDGNVSDKGPGTDAHANDAGTN